MVATYPSLELGNLLIRKGIRLRDDGNQVHSGMQLTHELNVDRLQAEGDRPYQRCAEGALLEALTSDQ